MSLKLAICMEYLLQGQDIGKFTIFLLKSRLI